MKILSPIEMNWRTSSSPRETSRSIRSPRTQWTSTTTDHNFLRNWRTGRLMKQTKVNLLPTFPGKLPCYTKIRKEDFMKMTESRMEVQLGEETDEVWIRPSEWDRYDDVYRTMTGLRFTREKNIRRALPVTVRLPNENLVRALVEKVHHSFVDFLDVDSGGRGTVSVANVFSTHNELLCIPPRAQRCKISSQSIVSVEILQKRVAECFLEASQSIRVFRNSFGCCQLPWMFIRV